jgi:hypothetical protein
MELLPPAIRKHPSLYDVADKLAKTSVCVVLCITQTGFQVLCELHDQLVSLCVYI